MFRCLGSRRRRGRRGKRECFNRLELIIMKLFCQPVAMFITQDEQTESIEQCLKILSSWIPKIQPIMLMTDNDSAEKTAVRRTWPNVTVLLCDFHVKADVWKNLRSKVGEEMATPIFLLFKSVVHAQDLSTFEEAKKKLLLKVEGSKDLVDYFSYYFGFAEVHLITFIVALLFFQAVTFYLPGDKTFVHLKCFYVHHNLHYKHTQLRCGEET